MIAQKSTELPDQLSHGDGELRNGPTQKPGFFFLDLLPGVGCY